MWVTQTYLGNVEPDAKAYVYYFYEDYNGIQVEFTEQLQRELEDLGDVFGDKVSLLVPNPRYAGRIEAEVRNLEPLWWKLNGKLPGLFLTTRPLTQITEYSSDCIYVPFAESQSRTISVQTAVQRIRELANDIVIWDTSATEEAKPSWGERVFKSIELKPGIWGLKLDLKKILSKSS